MLRSQEARTEDLPHSPERLKGYQLGSGPGCKVLTTVKENSWDFPANPTRLCKLGLLQPQSSTA